MNRELRKYFRSIGRKGGNATLKKYGKKKMISWAKRGGRPKKGTK